MATNPSRSRDRPDRLGGSILRPSRRTDALTTFPAGIAAATSASLAVLFTFIAMCRVADLRTAFISALIMAFGTSTWTVSADAMWPHGPDQLLVGLFLIAVATSRWWLAGVVAAAALFTRPLMAVPAAASALWLSCSMRTWRPALVVGAIGAIAAAGLVYLNWALFQELTVAPGSYGEFQGQFLGRSSSYDPTDPGSLLLNVAGMLGSPTRGVLVLSPFLVALAPGIPSAWRASPPWVRGAAVGGVAYAAMQLWGNNFAGGAGFYGYRYTLESLTLVSPLLVLCWTTWTSRTRTRRITFAILAVAAVVQHAVGALYETRFHESPYRSWKHYLLVESWEDAGSGHRVFALVFSVVAVAVTCALMRSRGASVRA